MNRSPSSDGRGIRLSFRRLGKGVSYASPFNITEQCKAASWCFLGRACPPCGSPLQSIFQSARLEMGRPTGGQCPKRRMALPVKNGVTILRTNQSKTLISMFTSDVKNDPFPLNQTFAKEQIEYEGANQMKTR